SSSGFVQLEVRSNPARATVLRGDRMYGTTPAKLEVRSGEQVELTIKKPGYAPERKALAASQDTRAVDVVLRQINGFEGTWVLPDGQLRAFTRSGDDHVDVYKLASLKGEKEFYRKFLFEDAPAGVRFASTDTVVDQRAPSEPSCQVPVRVEYIYDPQRDVLEVRPEGVETGYQNGRCVVHNRELVAAISLVRADASTAADVRVTHAPMGGPVDQPSLTQRPDQNLKNSDLEEKKRQLQKIEEGQKLRKPAPTKEPPPPKGKKAAANIDKKLDGPNSKEAFPDKAPAQAQNTPNAPPEPQQQVRGDSQIAPQVKK
ncbi:MAG: PEGA domain-containing protein, partial [Deltaproteobacteria bacterium]|nr:PEGA domain-containing protein [Deltaproteobacteria bacterium]